MQCRLQGKVPTRYSRLLARLYTRKYANVPISGYCTYMLHLHNAVIIFKCCRRSCVQQDKKKRTVYKLRLYSIVQREFKIVATRPVHQTRGRPRDHSSVILTIHDYQNGLPKITSILYTRHTEGCIFFNAFPHVPLMAPLCFLNACYLGNFLRCFES